MKDYENNRPLVIEVKVPEFTLDTVIAAVFARDEDGEEMHVGNATVGTEVARLIVERLVQDDQYQRLRETVLKIREDEIREQLKPVIAEAIQRPVQQTNGYGIPTGSPKDLTEIIMEEAKRLWSSGKDNRSFNPTTPFVQTLIRDAVQDAMGKEIKELVQKAKAQALGAIADKVSGELMTTVSEALRKG